MIAEREIETSRRLWTIIYRFGIDFKESFEKRKFDGMDDARMALEEVISEEGRFIGIEGIKEISERLLESVDVNLVNKKIEEHNSGSDEATNWLKDFWSDYAEKHWLPALCEIRTLHDPDDAQCEAAVK